MVQPNGVSYSLCVFSLILLGLWQNGSCGSAKMNATIQEQNRVATGGWGGQNVQMEVTDKGARLRFSCARGSIEQPIALDAEGRFSVEGTLVAEAMGPTNEDNPPKSQPAVFSGTVKDQEMTLTVTLKNSKDEPGKYSLNYGKPGRVFKCH
jgi:hypothetical protein